MNDIILSSLINLFALFGSSHNVDSNISRTTLRNYLVRHFGIREPQTYINLYEDLRSFYDDGMYKDTLVGDICKQLQSKITLQEQILMLLRLMEFCAASPNDEKELLSDSLFQSVAQQFKISDELFAKLVAFASCTPTSREVGDAGKDDVMLHRFGSKYEVTLKTLWLKEYNKLLFTYMGDEEVLMADIPVLPGAFQEWQKCDVLKCQRCIPAYYTSIMAAYGETDGPDAIEMCGRDINFHFANNPKFGMHNLSFSLKSGQLVAIMGGSGTGKTTLLTLLNGSIIPQEGSITINGHNIQEPNVKALIGYVPQDDLLIEELTVYQNLWFTAKLCFNGMPKEALHNKVIKTLSELGLEQAKDLKVGSPINKYISGGQRKRLNIALELIREPAVLFLDEPTSGLSSTDTEKVMNLLKEQTYNGKLIIVNIHQPSSDVYKLFDRLWLLDKGGYPVFDGNPIEAVSYFKNAAHYADANLTTCPTCGNVNPEVVLNIIDEKSINDSGQLTDTRKTTPQEWHQLYLDQRKTFEKPQEMAIPVSNQRRPSKLKQTAIFYMRNLKAKITDKQYMLITLLEAPVLAIICALLTHYAPVEGYSIMDNRNLMSYFFMAIIVSIFIGMSGSAEEIIKDRAILKRERFLRLSSASYIWSKILFVLTTTLIQTLLFVIVGNSIMGLHGMFWLWWLILFISAFLAGLTGLLLSQCLSSIVSIYITIPLLLIPQILLCGLVVDFSDLTPNSKTGNVPIIGDVIPSRWAFEALAVTSYTDNPYEKPLATLMQEKYTAQYYNEVFLNEMQSQLETLESERTKGDSMKASHLELIINEMPTLAAVCNLPPYDEPLSIATYDSATYTSLDKYFNQAKDILSNRGNNAILKADLIINRKLEELGGNKELIAFKKDNVNNKLSSLVLNENAAKTHDVIDDHIVPRIGFVYVEPRSHNGRAPFYSGVKIIGDWRVKTLWYNIGVLGIMSILVALALFYDIPGRYLRKQ